METLIIVPGLSGVRGYFAYLWNTFSMLVSILMENFNLERKRRGYAKSVSALGGLFVTLALVTYVIWNVFDSLDLSGAPTEVNTTVASIRTGAYGAMVMSVIIGIVVIAVIIMRLLNSAT